MEKKGSIKAVAALFFGVSMVGMLLSFGAVNVADLGAEPPTGVVQGP